LLKVTLPFLFADVLGER